MFKTLLCGLALAAASAVATAAEQTFEWSITGFKGLESDIWYPDMTARGDFVVDDANADGVYTLPEVKSFFYDIPQSAYCGVEASFSCTLSTFSFTPNGDIEFDYRIQDGGEWGYSWYSVRKTTWSSSIGNGVFPYSGEEFYAIYLMTPESKLTITPVPEPQTYLMLSSGALLLLGAARRRRLQR